MRIIGLTGGIACGKSSVSRYLSRSLSAGGKDAAVIDLDEVSRAVTIPGSPGLKEVIDHFGADFLVFGGILDRRKLGALVFSDPDQRKALEAILGPRIRQETESRIAGLRADNVGFCLLDTALLFEMGLDALCDATICVHCDVETQITRLAARNGFTRSEALNVIDAQMPWDERCARATYIIPNMGDHFEFVSEIELVWGQIEAKFPA